MADLKIFTENIEHEALNQIYTLVKHKRRQKGIYHG
uniref:Uncharacterized protein n=1 Tax=Siphoviridae sp. ct7yc1 TaxID=2827788 RepID=A0A8S5TJ65_9CAUD|nr:MAG TPA: hypothetical protein [Siphoviridae sp. ct7yc1]